jgi:hypothetical protein
MKLHTHIFSQAAKLSKSCCKVIESFFLIFINDLPVAVTSKTRLFADDCILYRQIYNHEDSITLQQDLDNLAAWEKRPSCGIVDFMVFCFSMVHVTNKNKGLGSAQHDK